MKVSLNWLGEYLNLKDLDLPDYLEKMILVGNEVAAYKPISRATGLVVGEIKKVSKPPQTDKLSVCLVDIGSGELLSIVCGASNVRENLKVVVALVGAKLPGDFIIKKAKIRQVESNGMLCSLEELGIESKYIPPNEKDNIHELPDDAPVGVDAINYLGFDDIIITYDLTANRGDLLSMLGMAYETGAILNQPVKLPKINITEAKESINDYLSLQVATKNCPLYLTRMITDIVIKESPHFIKTRLMASGIRSINNVVDISNYVMLEYGQPLHIFDYDKLGDKIKVRMAKDGETVITLDNEKRVLDQDDIVITSGKEVVALGGVMGCLNTEVTSNTKTIVIESALFNPLNIRNTAKKVLRSEASIRFEKGLDATKTKEALERACYLLQKYASGKVLKGILSHGKIDKVIKEITISQAKINRVLGMTLTKEEIGDVFKRLQLAFKINQDKFIVSIPNRRLDLNIEEDLIEEVGRLYGYDKLKGELPIVNIKPGQYQSKYWLIKKVKTKLQALGLNEAITYSLTNKISLDKFNYKKLDYIKIINPLSEDKDILRTNLLPSLLTIFEYNYARNIKDINIFEVASIFYQDNNQYHEEAYLAGLMLGNYVTNLWQGKTIEVDFYLVKGILEQLLNYFGVTDNYRFVSSTNIPKVFHPGKSAEIWVGEYLIGYVGCVNPSVNKLPIYMFELSLEPLFNQGLSKITYHEVPKYPAIIKDLAFIVDKKLPAQDLLTTINEIGKKILSSVDIFDIFMGDPIDTNKKSIALSLAFRHPKKTLTDKEVNKVISRIISEVTKKHQAILRDK